MITILVVDDEPSFREIFYNYLEDRGYKVLTSGDGVEATNICSSFKGKINLIVIDLVLPNEDSRSVADKLMRIRPESKVLYISAGQQRWLVENGKLNPLDAFLEKPFSLSYFEEMLKEMIYRSNQ